MSLSARATQDFVPIKEIRNGIVVLKNGGLRAILMVSSVNLSLKSSDEQSAIIMQFQSFLNTIDFPTQIVIQSRRYDIRPYLTILEGLMKDQSEPLLKIQTKEYIGFIKSLNESINIMSKNFFVVVPYSSIDDITSGTNIFKGIFSKKNKSEELASFEEKRTQLEQRVSSVQQSLSRIGIRSIMLGTEEVVELFYKTFNPGDLAGNIKLEV